jgi:tetratricopeptide (TPR) repeat protein
VWLYAILIVAVLATYGRIVRHDFVTWDDVGHITTNPLLDAVSWQNVGRFWREPFFAHYVPVSYTFYSAEAWLAQRSRDATGKAEFDPAVFHGGSLLLHLACVLLTYRLLTMLLGDARPACLGALFFALHPVQVESVAWVSEQRGLLAALFSLLSLISYLRFGAGVTRNNGSAERALAAGATGGLGYYLAASAAFALAVLAKPSAVSVPLIAASLDWFLLRRSWRTSALLLTPWLAGAAAILLITKHQQPDKLLDFVPPLWARPLIAGDALLFYLGKVVWPAELGILYRRAPEYVMSQWWFYGGWLVPLALAIVVARRAGRVGLTVVAWFLAVLLPVLGLTPFAHQLFSTVADRYLYLAMVAPAWGIACWSSTGKAWRRIGLCALLLVYGLLSFRQAAHWRTAATLYEQALRVNPFSDAAERNLGIDLFLLGKTEEAEKHLLRSYELNPRSALTVFYLGALLEKRGNVEEAEQLYRSALELDPTLRFPHVNLGVLLMNQQKHEAALSEFDAALRIEPSDVLAGFNRGLVLERTGRSAEALEQYRRVLVHWPEHYPSRLKAGMLLVSSGRRREAIDEFRYILTKQDDPGAHAELASVLLEQGDAQAAVEHYRQALANESPWWAAIAGRAAWLLATYPADEVRNGQQAMALAQEACRRTNHQNPELLQALAAAKAEVGDFSVAVDIAQQALRRAAELGETARTAELEEQLQAYRQQRAFRSREAARPSVAPER